MKKTQRKDRNRLTRLKGRGKDCFFCKSKKDPNWRDFEKLREYLTPRCRIMSAQASGVCMKHQRKLSVVIKEARELGLLPYSATEE
ncbi:MAG: 30S ribosomal protein S18 [Candidatus Shapirobacteria bacterium]|jgi:small subunit ribosomal protein S18|nr:30S ribosomal protein S18 [Candidatus Shapirobacteria bacterium]